jgi:signal transduction histidine kinase/putative methionine-R-sulfoxide reductase with GAF domain
MTEQAITSTLFDIHEMLLEVIRRAREIIPFDSGGLIPYDPIKQTLVPTPDLYLSDGVNTLVPIRLGMGVIGQVAQKRKPEMVNDMENDPRRQYLDTRSRSELAVPVLLEDKLLGVFNVESHKPGAYEDIHLRVLQMLADQTALVIHTFRRYQDLSVSYTDLMHEMRARLREIGALQRLATITSATLNLDEMLANAVRETTDLLDCEGAQLLMPDHVAYVLTVHMPSLHGITQAWPARSWPLDGPGYLVDVYHRGQPYITQVPPPEADPGCRNVMACPLNTRNRTLGVLQFINQRSGAFSESQIEIAQAIANQIAVSMSSAQMFAAERRRADMMSQINRVSQALYATLDPQGLLRKIAQSIHEVLGHEAVYVFLLSEDRQHAHLRASATSSPRLENREETSIPVSEGVIGRAIRSGQTQIVPDVRNDPDYVPMGDHHRLQSSLIVPLRQGDYTIGAITVQSTQLNAFSDLERDALETLATQVSIALENARLYNQAQRRLLEQSIVHQIGQDLTAILNYGELVQTMVKHMNRALDSSCCLMATYHPQTNQVTVEAEYHAPDFKPATATPTTGQRLAPDEYFVFNEAIRLRQPVTAYVNQPDTPPAAREQLEKLGVSSQLTLPMTAGERILGVVTWVDQEPGRIFTQADTQLAQTLVAQSSVAIDNAELFRELETRALELAEANRLKNQFLATISHELRTPMNSIIGFSDTLLSGLYGDLNEKQASRIERIQRNGYSLLTLIDDLLDLSKIDAGRMPLKIEQVDVHESIMAVAQSMEAQATQQGLEMAFEIEPDLPPARADTQRLRQVITNLLSNAIKFTREGSITIRGKRVERNGAPFVEITMADTGIGINPDDQAIIFDEFRQVDGSSTRMFGGTGLGLAITKRLIEMMDGTIWVTSEPEHGSEFSFVLPVAESEDPS